MRRASVNVTSPLAYRERIDRRQVQRPSLWQAVLLHTRYLEKSQIN